MSNAFLAINLITVIVVYIGTKYKMYASFLHRYFLQVRDFATNPHGVDVNAADNFGNTPMHLATARGHRHTLNILLQSGLDVNARNEFGQASLHLAAYLGNIDIVMCLVLGNADIDITDRENNTPLILVSRRGHIQIALFLLNRSCDYTTCANQDGVSHDALQSAAKAGNITLCQILVDAGSDPFRLGPIIADMKSKPDGEEPLTGIHNFFKVDHKTELIRMCYYPRTLQSWCRIAIRNVFQGNKVSKIEALPLPRRFNQSLLLRDYVYLM